MVIAISRTPPGGLRVSSRAAWISLAALLASCGPPIEPAPPPPPYTTPTSTATAAPAPDPLAPDPASLARIDANVKLLASEALAGRGTGDPGNREAAEHIAHEFEAMGLAPAGDASDADPAKRSYFQRFSAKIGARVTRERAEIRVEPWPKAPAPIVRAAEGSASATASAKAVFVGYGIKATSLGWDEYGGKDIEGKIAVVLAGTPPVAGASASPHASQGAPTSPHAVTSPDPKLTALREFGAYRYKIREAREHKAVGVLFIVNGELPPPPNDVADMGLPAIVIGRADATNLRGVDVTKDKTWAITKPGKPIALRNPHIYLDAKIEPVTADTWNVLGAWAPKDVALSDPSREWIVLGAHYDHLGFGGQHSRAPGKRAIHPGADDNASGTAALLETANRLVRVKSPMKRGFVFASFGAEEIGLLGSRHFIDHAPVPRSQMAAMINFDMVGRMREGQLLVDGTGTAEAWPSLATDAAEGLPLKITFGAEGFGASDHATFTAARVPVAFLFTGVHEDYHLPSDTADKINVEGIAHVALFATRLAKGVADRPDRMAFVDAPADPHRGVRGGFKVSIGTLPDYAYQGKGLRITGVRPDSPASRAGLQGGDTIVKIGTHDVTNIHDYMFVLRELEPGKEVTIEVERGTSRATLKVIPAPGAQ